MLLKRPPNDLKYGHVWNKCCPPRLLRDGASWHCCHHSLHTRLMLLMRHSMSDITLNLECHRESGYLAAIHGRQWKPLGPAPFQLPLIISEEANYSHCYYCHSDVFVRSKVTSFYVWWVFQQFAPMAQVDFRTGIRFNFHSRCQERYISVNAIIVTMVIL